MSTYLEYLGYLWLYQHPPMISFGGAKMELEKQWEMDEVTQRNDEAKDPKEQNPISNISNKCGTKKGRPEEENFSQETGLPETVQKQLPTSRLHKNHLYIVLPQQCFIVRRHVRPCSRL